MKYLIVVCLVLFSFCYEVKAQGAFDDNGKMWAVMSDTEKYFYVKGFKEGCDRQHIIEFIGQLRIRELLLGFIKDATVKANLDKSTQDMSLKTIADGRVEPFTESQIVNQMNVLYRDEQNRKITLMDIFDLAVSKLKGEDIIKKLIDRRKFYQDPDGYLKESREKLYKSSEKK